MNAYPDWDPDENYSKGDRAVLDGKLYVAAEPVVAIKPDPGSGFDHWPWVYLGRYST